MRKIDIFINQLYYCSTNRYKTCKEAKQSVVDKLQSKSKLIPYYIESTENIKVTAHFDKLR